MGIKLRVSVVLLSYQTLVHRDHIFAQNRLPTEIHTRQQGTVKTKQYLKHHEILIRQIILITQITFEKTDSRDQRNEITSYLGANLRYLSSTAAPLLAVIKKPICSTFLKYIVKPVIGRHVTLRESFHYSPAQLRSIEVL